MAWNTVKFFNQQMHFLNKISLQYQSFLVLGAVVRNFLNWNVKSVQKRGLTVECNNYSTIQLFMFITFSYPRRRCIIAVNAAARRSQHCGFESQNNFSRFFLFFLTWKFNAWDTSECKQRYENYLAHIDNL